MAQQAVMIIFGAAQWRALKELAKRRGDTKTDVINRAIMVGAEVLDAFYETHGATGVTVLGAKKQRGPITLGVFLAYWYMPDRTIHINVHNRAWETLRRFKAANEPNVDGAANRLVMAGIAGLHAAQGRDYFYIDVAREEEMPLTLKIYIK